MGLPNINEFINNVRTVEMGYIERKAKRIENGYLLIQLLASEGLLLEVNEWNLQYGYVFTVTPKQLAIVRRVLGRLEKVRLDPVPKSKNKVWDVRKPVDERFADFKFQFKTTLPADAPCKIVKRRRTINDRAVVCGV